MPIPFHVVYQLGDGHKPDHIIDIIQTNDPRDIPASSDDDIVMQLEAHDRLEADAEIRELGFSY